MPEQKTKQNDQSVRAFLEGVADAQRREDCFAVLKLMKDVTRTEPKMWGSSIVGFGTYHYKYASGREGDMPVTGFSPRKDNLTLYLMGGFGEHADLMKKLGKHKTGKGCLYVKRLDDIHLPTLKELVKRSVAYVRSGKMNG